MRGCSKWTSASASPKPMRARSASWCRRSTTRKLRPSWRGSKPRWRCTGSRCVRPSTSGARKEAFRRPMRWRSCEPGCRTSPAAASVHCFPNCSLRKTATATWRRPTSGFPCAGVSSMPAWCGPAAQTQPCRRCCASRSILPRTTHSTAPPKAMSASRRTCAAARPTARAPYGRSFATVKTPPPSSTGLPGRRGATAASPCSATATPATPPGPPPAGDRLPSRPSPRSRRWRRASTSRWPDKSSATPWSAGRRRTRLPSPCGPAPTLTPARTPCGRHSTRAGTVAIAPTGTSTASCWASAAG
ncbi:hypothetical protein D9M72_301730 [compost metagenome]